MTEIIVCTPTTQNIQDVAFKNTKFFIFESDLLNTNNPPPQALARSYHWTIAPCGNTALNLLGLSTQVTAVWSYISDGPYETYELNSTKLEFSCLTLHFNYYKQKATNENHT